LLQNVPEDKCPKLEINWNEFAVFEKCGENTMVGASRAQGKVLIGELN
jgi:hypothetical protein